MDPSEWMRDWWKWLRIMSSGGISCGAHAYYFVKNEFVHKRYKHLYTIEIWYVGFLGSSQSANRSKGRLGQHNLQLLLRFLKWKIDSAFILLLLWPLIGSHLNFLRIIVSTWHSSCTSWRKESLKHMNLVSVGLRQVYVSQWSVTSFITCCCGVTFSSGPLPDISELALCDVCIADSPASLSCFDSSSCSYKAKSTY
jgi:hypothetical protein